MLMRNLYLLCLIICCNFYIFQYDRATNNYYIKFSRLCKLFFIKLLLRMRQLPLPTNYKIIYTLYHTGCSYILISKS